MRAHYITENPSGYRGRLFPRDNRAFSLALYTVLASDANKYNTEDREGDEFNDEGVTRRSFDKGAVHIIKALANEEQALVSVGSAH